MPSGMTTPRTALDSRGNATRPAPAPARERGTERSGLRELGRGLSAYARADAARILGRKSSEIADILGFEGGPELIHRNDMALARK